MQSQTNPGIDWGEIVQWCKFYLSSDHNGTESVGALIGGVHHREYRRIEEDTLYLSGGRIIDKRLALTDKKSMDSE